MKAARYALHKYSPLHWAIDCDDCKCKICNLTPNQTSGEIIDKLNIHEVKYHKDLS
jgi:hypothetical protein